MGIYRFLLREDLEERKEFLPARADVRATGWDVRCAAPDGIEVQPSEYIMVPLGWRVYCPPGGWLELRPRSSTFTKKHLHALYGVVDESYEGEVFFACQYLPPTDSPRTIEFGERIAQVVPMQRDMLVVKECNTVQLKELFQKRGGGRGSGGFGSTGDG